MTSVEFFIDSTQIGEDAQTPFALQFSTDDYPLGVHTMVAIGATSDGQELRTNEITANFVSASEGNKTSAKIIIPLVSIVFVAMLLSFVVPLLMGRGKIQNLPLGTERTYGFGGGICPKCRRPFALPLFSMNLGLSKLARCPHCAKWGLARIQPLNKLREAEQAELDEQRTLVPEESDREKLKKELDDSKYQGI